VKYILTEKQLEVIEVGTVRGRYNASPENNLWDYFENNLKKKQKIESFKKYYNKVLTEKTNLVGDNTILLFFKELSDKSINSDIPKEFLKEDLVSGFAYYVAKHYFDLTKGVNISYIKVKDILGGKDYFFFDSTFKIFVGMVLTMKYSKLPKNSYTVRTSAAVKSLIGQGYGVKMYLNVIKDVDYLRSDTLLYTGSLRMWRDVLSRYVNVWAVYTTGSLTKNVKLHPGKKIIVNNVDYFVASAYHNTID